MSRAREIWSRSGRAPGAGRGAFTLIEILVAVGAVAIVSVGLAAVFDAVGKTVAGGRRVNHLNAAAALLEQRMRSDFDSITRDGFIVIRQQFADANNDRRIVRNQDAIPLHSNEPFNRWRLRRIDEIMFFARGEFTSGREPLHPAYVAHSDTARIYYGHGQRRIEDLTPNSWYLRPNLGDAQGDADAANAKLGRLVADNPNRYAADWTLLRHATVLADPRTANANAPQTPVLDLDPRQINDLKRMMDRDCQVALLPAASSVFRSLNAAGARVGTLGQVTAPNVANPQDPEHCMWADDPRYPTNPAIRPQFASGLLDVVTNSMEEIRWIVTTMNGTPADLQLNASNWQFPAGWKSFQAVPSPTSNLWPYGVMDLSKSLPPYTARGTAQMEIARRWMSDAMPTKSDWSEVASSATEPWPGGVRMRYEPQPPDYMGVLTDATLNPPGSPQSSRRLAQLRADQLMLASGNFMARCTEFQVEWSFGQMDPLNNDIIWYGAWVDVDNDGRPEITRYPFAGTQSVQLKVPYKRNDGQTAEYFMNPDLLYGDLTGRQLDLPLTTYFGYVDATANPAPLGTDTNNDGDFTNDPDDPQTGTVPQWPWPKMIRVTMRLADARDPSIEETFQFVFDLPPPQAQ